MKLGRVSVLWLVLWTFGAGCSKQATTPSSEATLRVLCGSSMAAPIQEIGRQFAQAQGVRIEFDLGGSETLLPKILAGAKADVFVCHDPFEDKLKAAGRWNDTVTIGYLEPVLAVRPGNPKAIRAVRDLAKPGPRLGIGDPRYSTCGELFVRALRERMIEEDVMRNVVLQARSHGEMANGLIVGSLDAVVVWNFVVGLYPGKLEVVPTGIAYPATRVTLLGLTTSEHPPLREAFLAWCRQPAARETFRRYGYTREEK
ncbi:MAG: substrate-binding domain-containing protein [Lentisphaerae bacterium]|nr:substrate-binding domain-containing protein [Lentisphaerota bacterium]